MKKIFPLLLAPLLLLSGCAQKETSSTQNNTVGDMTIALDTLGETPAFLQMGPSTVSRCRSSLSAVQMARFAFRIIRARFVRAYFELQNGQLVCQNCGNAFSLSAIGKDGYGCMPLMVPAYTLTDTSVVIPHDTLAQAKDAFENWKVFP